MRDTEREKEAETQAEGEVGSRQGAQHGTRSRVSRVTPWAEGCAKPLSNPGCLHSTYYFSSGLDLTVLRSSPTLGPVLGVEPAFPSAYVSASLSLSLSLSLMNK